MTAEEAKRIVLERHPGAVAEHSHARSSVMIFASGRYGGMLSGNCKTEDAAWISAAKKLKAVAK